MNIFVIQYHENQIEVIPFFIGEWPFYIENMNHKFYICLLPLFLLAATSNASVVINEMMVRNVSSHINEDFNYEGWVELYNSGAESVDLSDCYFSNTSSNVYLWQSGVADLTLAPGAFAVFYFDEMDLNNHASFKLDADGGLLILSDKNGNQLDKVSYPKPYRNVSYGRTEDGGANFGFFVSPTLGVTNGGSVVASKQTVAPTFNLDGGFYSSAQTVAILSANASAKVYYTTDGREPDAQTGTLYSSPIRLDASSPLRAIAVADGELVSDVATASYFIGIDSIPTSIPVVSLVTEPEMLYGDQIGILVVGRNGLPVPSKCGSMDMNANYMHEWDRPCNFEFFDEKGTSQLNQEVKVGVFGACSRTKAIKSIRVKANKIYGNNKLNYPIFKEKPNMKLKSVVLRNSGNDFAHLFFRDAYLQTLAASHMDLDHQAYQPAVIFVNGKYYAMFGIRERTNKDFLYSNYALDEDEFCIEESTNQADECGDYQSVVDLSNDGNMDAPDMFGKIDELIDVDEFLNYFMAQIYFCNNDWADGNIKAWKRNGSGKWRWIMYDTDMTFSLYSDYLNTDGFSNATKSSVFAKILNNGEVKNRLMNKFVYHLGTTFTQERSSHILDSLTNKVRKEANYFFRYLKSMNKLEVSSWEDEIEKVRNFAAAREEYVHQHVAAKLGLGSPLPLRVFSNVKGARYLLNDLELIDVDDFSGRYYKGSQLKLTPYAPDGFLFKEWEVYRERNIITTGDAWKYLYQSEAVDANWKNRDFDDSSWSSNISPLGSGLSYFNKTTITGNTGGMGGGFGGFGGGMGGFESSANITSYFRKKFNIPGLSSAGTLHFTMRVNDGAVVYMNGKEVYRFNVPDGVLNENTFAIREMSSYAIVSFDVDKSCLQEGENLVAVELHNAQNSSSSSFMPSDNTKGSSTLTFDLKLSEENSALTKVKTIGDETYSATFNDSLVLKAVFVEDPSWDPSVLKLYLNEICVSNGQHVDEFMESEDWIEIYNDGTSAVDLGGMYLSDKRKNLTKFQIPTGSPLKTTVQAKGYIVFWADADSSMQGPLHTNFVLPKTRNQTVSLSRMYDGELQLIDSIRYMPHEKGETFARFSYEGDGNWMVTSRPTFSAKNVYMPSVVGETNIFSADAVARVYPNPVTDYLWFSFPWKESTQVIVSDYTGKMMGVYQISSGESLYVGALPSGVYYAVLFAPEGNRQLIRFVRQ